MCDVTVSPSLLVPAGSTCTIIARLRLRSLAALLTGALILGLGAPGCDDGGGGNHVKPYADTTLAPGSHWLGAAYGTTIVDVQADSVLLTLDAGAPTITVGDIVIDADGDGFVRRVTALSTPAAGQLLLTTEAAALSEAFDQFNTGFTLEIGNDTIEGQPAGGVQPVARDQSRAVTFDLTGVTIYDGTYATITITSGELRAFVRAWGDINIPGDSDLGFMLDIEIDATIAASLHAGISLDGSIPIPGAGWGATLKIGNVRTRVNLGLFAEYLLEADATVTVTTSFSYTDHIRCDVQYVFLQGWEQDRFDRDPTFSYTDPVVTGEANAMLLVALTPRVTVELLGTTGVDLAVSAFARATADAQLTADQLLSYGIVVELGLTGHVTTFPDWEDSAVCIDEQLDDIVMWEWERQRRLVTGRITRPPVGTITMHLDGTLHADGTPYSATVTCDGDAKFAFTGVPRGTYIVKPVLSGAAFSPSQRDVTVVRADPDPLVFDNVTDRDWITLLRGGPTSNKYYRGVWVAPNGEVFVVGSEGEDGLILHSTDGMTFGTPTVVSERLRSVWGFAADDVWAVGEEGMVLHYNGFGWSRASDHPAIDPAGSDHDWLNRVWGPAGDDVYALSLDGVYHYNGISWSGPANDLSQDVSAAHALVWGAGPSHKLIIPNGADALEFDGANWTTFTPPWSGYYHDIWGFAPDDYFVVGSGTNIWHHTASGDERIGTPVTGPQYDVYAAWGTSATNMYFGLDYDRIYTYNGSAGGCRSDTVDTGEIDGVYYRDIHGIADDYIFAVGSKGRIMRGK
jgi:hypothetical protein